jgi:hypothetical protein
MRDPQQNKIQSKKMFVFFTKRIPSLVIPFFVLKNFLMGGRGKSLSQTRVSLK